MVVIAPLAAGAVHRPTMVALMLGGAVCIALLSGGLALQGRRLRVGAAFLVPLAFTLIPLLQSIPMPLSVRGLFDSTGTALLRDNDVGPASWWPLSLDPPATRMYVGRAAVALVVFLVAYHLASGQTRRHLLLRVVAGVGLAAVAIGLGHRIFAMPRVYGVLNTSGRALVTGPFVNVNHTAELLELATFVCLACSLQRDSALNRIGWLVGAALCAGGALATLSRGAVIALAMGALVFAFLRYLASDGTASNRRRSALAWGALIVAACVVGALSFGAGAMVDRFRADAITADTRFHLWRDGLRVFIAHPFGIGRGAFDRVFPIYRLFKMPFPIRFAFVENEPLQLLVDCGAFFFLLLAAAVVALIGWRVVRAGRRDKVEAALLAGLLAVVAHSILDFGLETLGVLLPFVAVLGSVLGRLRAPPQSPRLARAGWAIAGVAFACALFGALATAHPRSDDFDALLKKPLSVDARRSLLTRATQTHPLDYFYALSLARQLPLKGGPGEASPRLHELNRALRLCPGCETAHVEVARNLWKIGLRRQALLEWRTAIDIQPTLFTSLVGELFMAGGRPEELAALASTDGGRALQLAGFLSSRDRVDEAFAVLDQAEALGTARGEVLITRAELQFRAHRLEAAAASVQAALQLGIQSTRLGVLQARLLIAAKDAEGADEALTILDQAATRNPSDLPAQQERIDLVLKYKKWNAAPRSLEGYKLALFNKYGAATDAHIYAARIDGQLGRWQKSLDEYRIALVDRPTEVPLWLEYGRAAESAGRDIIARDAYAQASRLSPNSPDIANAQRALEERSLHLQQIREGIRAAVPHE